MESLDRLDIKNIHLRKLTWLYSWKIHHLKMSYLKNVMFHCHVSFQGSKPWERPKRCKHKAQCWEMANSKARNEFTTWSCFKTSISLTLKQRGDTCHMSKTETCSSSKFRTPKKWLNCRCFWVNEFKFAPLHLICKNSCCAKFPKFLPMRLFWCGRPNHAQGCRQNFLTVPVKWATKNRRSYQQIFGERAPWILS